MTDLSAASVLCHRRCSCHHLAVQDLETIEHHANFSARWRHHLGSVSVGRPRFHEFHRSVQPWYPFESGTRASDGLGNQFSPSSSAPFAFLL